MTTRQRHERQSGTYRALIGIAEEVVANARMVLERTGKRRGKDIFADLAIDRSGNRSRTTVAWGAA